MRKNKLKELWKEGKTALNAWLTIPNAWTAETMAHAGFDAITIDMRARINTLSKTNVENLLSHATSLAGWRT